MIYLVDTNLFLEILLRQSKRETCKDFLQQNAGKFYISDFSFHSIGVILLKHGKSVIFKKFIEDLLPSIEIISLSISNYHILTSIHEERQLDFDDAYQFAVARTNHLQIVTLDRDFMKVQDLTDVIFL
jgi:predicted nucleic acid-binding protein